MNKTIVGIFDKFEEAQTAVGSLKNAGVKPDDVSIARNKGNGDGYTIYDGEISKNSDNGKSIGGEIMSFLGGLLGADNDQLQIDEHGIFAESVRRGSTVVTAQVAENMADKAADILNDNGAVDIDRRQAQYRAAGYKKFDATAKPYSAEQTRDEMKNFNFQSEIALPVIKEQLNVGKRVVNRGGVRVYTTVSEKSVERQINLREEKVNVERHKVDRKATDADMKNFKEGDFAVRTKAEEAVVGKTARVVEEVVIGKDVTERTETIKDSVRRTHVEVAEINADAKSKKARN